MLRGRIRTANGGSDAPLPHTVTGRRGRAEQVGVVEAHGGEAIPRGDATVGALPAKECAAGRTNGADVPVSTLGTVLAGVGCPSVEAQR